MPKKLTPKSQAKKYSPIPAIPILNYFLTLKKHHANKYIILSSNCIMRIYNYVIYYKLLVFLRSLNI